MKLNKKGFTLIELMITIMILLIVLGMVGGLVLFSTKFFRDENTQLLSQDSLRMIALDIEKDIRRYVGSSSDFYPKDGCIHLRVDINEENNIVYCQVGDRITRMSSGTSIVIGERIETFIATYDLSDDSILLKIVTQSDPRGMKNSIDFKVYIRTGRAG